MADFTTLAPAELVRQLGKPEGEVGVDVALRMNQLNLRINEAVYSRLDLAAGMAVLEIGFGNGRLLPSLMQRADGLNYVGVDVSPTMVEEARRFNAPLVDVGQAAFHLADAVEIHRGERRGREAARLVSVGAQTPRRERAGRPQQIVRLAEPVLSSLPRIAGVGAGRRNKRR